MNADSRLLEVACTTGFSSRELAILTGCKGKGFDLSEKSIEMAEYNKKRYAPKINFSYEVADGYKYSVNKKYSHIAVGASLKFFPDPEKMLGRCIEMLKDNGYLLASPFYVTDQIPDNLVRRFKKIFDITPTNVSYKEIMSLYNKLEVIYENRNKLVKETEDELIHYCHSTTKRACEIRNIDDNKVYHSMFNKLLEVKKMSNDLRPYQEYSVLVLRYRKSVYPNRFVELF
jgi:SAM-dependent methyltransferase